MLTALLTLILLGEGSNDLTKSVAEGRSTLAIIVVGPERLQTVLKILAEVEQTVSVDKADTEVQLART